MMPAAAVIRRGQALSGFTGCKGSVDGKAWYDFAKEIVALTEANCKVNPVTTEEYPSKVKRPAYSILDKTKIKETFNLEIRDWREALKSCMATF